MARTRRGFGTIRRLPSGRWQATYVAPDDRRHAAPDTFEAKQDAEDWLSRERAMIRTGTWSPPSTRGKGGLTFGQYAQDWLARRELRPRTKVLYRDQLDRYLLPAFRDMPLATIKPADVRVWFATMDPSKPTARAQTYGLLRTILGTALTDELIPVQPCTIRGASGTKRKREIVLATPEQLDLIVANMPDRLALWPLLSMWGALRFGEVAELRRKDIDIKRGRLHITRAVTEVKDVGPVVGPPKSRAGVRWVPLPPHIVPLIVEHLDQHTGPGRDALLFPMHVGGDRNITSGWMSKMAWGPARKAAGRPDLRLHDLRHTGGTVFAQAGGTQAETMAYMGHDSTQAAAIYQHAARNRTADVAAKMASVWA